MSSARIEQIRAFLAQNDADPFLHHALGMEYLSAGDSEAARQQFQSVVARFPTYVGAYYQLGKLLEQAGDNENAASIYQKGIQQAEAQKDANSLRELKEALVYLTGGADDDDDF